MPTVRVAWDLGWYWVGRMLILDIFDQTMSTCLTDDDDNRLYELDK